MKSKVEPQPAETKTAKEIADECFANLIKSLGGIKKVVPFYPGCFIVTANSGSRFRIRPEPYFPDQAVLDNTKQ